MGPALLTFIVAATNAPYVRSRANTGVPNDIHAQCMVWKTPTVIFNQNALGNPDTTNEDEFAAISRSLQTWQAVSDDCGSLSLQEGARVPERAADYDPLASDNRNLVLFRTQKCSTVAPSNSSCWAQQTCQNIYDCWMWQSGTIAITTTTHDPETGEIFDADIELNASSFTFTARDGAVCPFALQNQSCIATDVENTMTHEFGHALGLDHTDYPASTMNPQAPLGETTKRTVDPGSKQFICDVYPKGLEPRDCILQPVPKTLGRAAGCSSGEGLNAGGLAALLLAIFTRRLPRVRA
jgi:hypothetical protein